jgi:hypothetical protein
MEAMAKSPREAYIEVRYTLKVGCRNFGVKVAMVQTTARAETTVQYNYCRFGSQ